MSKIFLISPVNGVDDALKSEMGDYVQMHEARAHKVHWPLRDTDQDDPIGNRICQDNREKIRAADEIHVWYSPTSKGSCFDLGMMLAFMYQDYSENGRVMRNVVVANPGDLRRAPGSIQRLLLSHLCDIVISPDSGSQEYMMWQMGIIGLPAHMHLLMNTNSVCVNFLPDQHLTLLKLGMAFAVMRDRPLKFYLPEKFPILPTQGKSFENLVLWLVEYTKDGPKTI